MRALVVAGIAWLALTACTEDVAKTVTPGDVGGADVGRATDAGPDAASTSLLGRIVGDPCREAADCEPTGVPGLRCLPPGARHRPPDARHAGRPIADGMCSVRCETDDSCPVDSVCSLWVSGLRFCTPACTPGAVADPCGRDDLRCGTELACVPRCDGDETCEPGRVCLPSGACRNPGPDDPSEALQDGEACTSDRACRAGAICFGQTVEGAIQGFCTMAGCDLGGDRACQQTRPPARPVHCVHFGGLGANPATERRALALCLPECDPLEANSCPDGSACHPPETDLLLDAPGPVCFVAPYPEGDRDIGRACNKASQCRDGLATTALQECFLPSDEGGFLPNGRCTTLPGACGNDALRDAGLCGPTGDCFAVHRPSALTCHRACTPGGEPCAAGDACYPYAGGRGGQALSPDGVCLPPCHGLPLDICGRASGAAPCGSAGPDACALWVRCDPDGPGETCPLPDRCHPVVGGPQIDAFRVRPGAAAGVCLPPCDRSTNWCAPELGGCVEGRCAVRL